MPARRWPLYWSISARRSFRRPRVRRTFHPFSGGVAGGLLGGRQFRKGSFFDLVAGPQRKAFLDGVDGKDGGGEGRAPVGGGGPVVGEVVGVAVFERDLDALLEPDGIGHVEAVAVVEARHVPRGPWCRS